MRDTDLNNRLNTYKAPEPSDLLKARILKAAKAENAALASTLAPVRTSFAKRFMPIAASLVAVCAIGFAAVQVSQTHETETTAAWQEAATDLGFDDIYDWVETEDASAQES